MADRSSFEAFAEAQFASLVTSLTFHCGDVEVAHELAQDALARAYQRWRRVSGMDRPDAWVRTVAFNLSRSRFRRRGAERRANARHGPTPAHGDTRAVDGVDARVDVHRAVAALPPRQREVVIHHHLLERSVAETAAELGISHSAVTSALSKGRANLARLLATADHDPVEQQHG